MFSIVKKLKELSNQTKEIEDLHESVQILSLENIQLKEDVNKLLETISAVFSSTITIADQQKKQSETINMNTTAPSKVINCLIDAGLLDPDKPDPTFN